jgi:hypothetical protein
VRTFLIVIVIVVLIAGGVALYLVMSTPSTSAGVRFPITPAQRVLLGNVSASADAFALVPTAAAFEAKLRTNPVTRQAVEEWSSSRPLLPPWMIGGADLVVWRSGKRTSYALNLDWFRSLVVRVWMMAGTSIDARWNGSALLLNAPNDAPMTAADLEALLALGNGLPAGDALAIQREGARGAFPPIGRPAATTARVTPDAISIASRSPRASDRPLPPSSLDARFPRGSMLTAAFSAPPRIIDEMNRLVGARASALLRDGGEIVLYGVDSHKLLPRPREVIVLPSTPERRIALQDFLSHTAPNQLQQALGFHIETADTGTKLLVAFDRDSIDRYRADTLDFPTLPATSWSIRVDPKRAVPMLQQIADSPGLRYLAPRLFRSARDLGDWIDHLQAASSIEAADSVSATEEELRVIIQVHPEQGTARAASERE